MRMMKRNWFYNGTANTECTVSNEVLDEFRKTVGKLPPETCGMLACKENINRVDTWRFDEKSINSRAACTYDAVSMNEQYKEWRSKGIISVGFVHSHPETYRQPSYEDIATARALMKFFNNDFFYLPIIISNKYGCFTMYFYVVRQVGRHLNVNLDFVQKANDEGYEMVPFRHWEEDYPISEVEAYYNSVNGVQEKPTSASDRTIQVKESHIDARVDGRFKVKACSGVEIRPIDHAYAVAEVHSKSAQGSRDNNAEKKHDSKTVNKMGMFSNDEYFKRVKGLFPEKVKDKVIVCVGTGGARSYLETMARGGFHNFVLIDGDRISPPNISTQHVYRSEMGMWKTEAIRAKIHDINPEAKVVCVNRFLNNDFTDRDFKVCLTSNFPRKAPTDFLVLGCCDTFEGNDRSAKLSLKYGYPYIGAGMYKGGLCAEILFTYPGVTPSCPRCMINSRYEAYEEGYTNDVTSENCDPFSTERLNSELGKISIMMLMYGEAPNSPYNKMLDDVKDRNFVWIRNTPYLNESDLKIGLFDRVFGSDEVKKYTFSDETLWIPQHPNSPKFGEKTCKLCGGTGDLRKLQYKLIDTRKVPVWRTA